MESFFVFIPSPHPRQFEENLGFGGPGIMENYHRTSLTRSSPFPLYDAYMS